MAEQEQRPSVRRRSSLGRALDRVKDALKRRRSSSAAVPTLQSTGEEGTAAIPQAAEQPPVDPGEAAKQDERADTEPKAAGPNESTADSQLVPDDGLEEEGDDNEEPLTQGFSSRAGLTEEKTRALFERYGIKYEPRMGAQLGRSPSPSKIRRVERPVRIRIHWTCHECERQFGHDRACRGCGHRRCADCSRSPPKKVKAILDEAKQSRIAEERTAANKEQILAAISPNTVAAPGQPRVATSGPRELEVDDEENVDLSQLTMEQRPRSGIRLVMRSKPGADREAPFEPTMVATVQRVHRKPRQRVRWQCDKCETIFLGGHHCRVCNHERCEQCVRSPAKRSPREPDPAVVQSLNDKIDAWQRQRAQALESSATQLEPEPGLS